MAALDPDGAVRIECPVGIVRDLPDVTLGIGKGTGGTAPLRPGGRPEDGAACLLGFGQDSADLVGRAHVEGELDAGSTVTAERGPQAENHAAGLKEAHLIVRLLRIAPAERLIERTSSGEIGDAKCHKADALVHAEIIADGRAMVRSSRPTLQASWNR